MNGKRKKKQSKLYIERFRNHVEKSKATKKYVSVPKQCIYSTGTPARNKDKRKKKQKREKEKKGNVSRTLHLEF